MSNYFTVTGNLTADPELRFTATGDAVANFTVADTPRKFNKQTNAWEDAGETLFMRCSIWREDAEQVAESVRRGQRVTVTGKLKQRSYEKDGDKRTVVEMDAESVAPHGQRKAGQRSSAPAGGDPWATQPERIGDNGLRTGGRTSYDEPPF